MEFKTFLFETLLFEDKVDFITDRQGDKVLSAYEKDTGSKPKFKDPKSVVQYIGSEISEKYVQWLVNRYIAGNFRLEDKSRVSDTLKKYDKLRTKLQQKDLNQYKSIADLEDAVEQFDSSELKSNRELNKERQQKYFDDKEATLFYQGGGVKVVIPNTKEASCYFGVGTRWCTAADKDNMFDTYNKKGKLYIVFLNNGRKYQFFFRKNQSQFMDEKDQDIVDFDSIVKEYPVLLDAFSRVAKKTGFLPLIKNPTDEDYLTAVKYDADGTVKIMNKINKPLPSSAAQEVFKKQFYLAASYVRAFTDEDFIKGLKDFQEYGASHTVIGRLRNKDATDKQLSEILDVLMTKKRHSEASNFIREIFTDNTFSKKYSKWIDNIPVDTKVKLIDIDDQLIEFFEDSLPEAVKIEIVKNRPHSINRFSNPTGKMKEAHRWLVQGQKRKGE